MSGRGKTVKMSVTLPGELAGEVRALVSQGEVSSFFTEALEHYLAFRKQKQALEAGYGAWKDEGHPDLNTPADSIDYVSDVRSADKERRERLSGDSAE
jgi:Arc/MetJ-type ribon-helix-helix transcriptional regulator